ncbi:MAG: hypothetical protein ACRDSM_14900, partial [Pseudonocardiaceae bacterium]
MTMRVSWGGGPARRSRLWVGGIVAVVVLGLGVGIATVTGALGSSPDRRAPADVAKAFIEFYAVHDPGACELVTASLRKRFAHDGRCAGTAHGTTPRIDVLNA